MTTFDRKRHVTLAALAFLAVFGVVMGGEVVVHAKHDAAVAAAAEQASFWRGVAGTGSTSAPTIENQLAEDLRDALGETDPRATSLPSGVETFKGNTNAYGGVSEALGFSPFVDAGCTECGPLTPKVKEKLLQVKRGEVEALVASETPADPGGYPLVPFGIGAVVLAAASGGYLTYPKLAERRRESRLDRQVRAAYGDCVEELDAIEAALAGTDPVTHKDREALEELKRTSAKMRIRLRTLAATGEDQDVSPSIHALRERTEDLNSGIDVRHQVYKELNGGA